MATLLRYTGNGVRKLGDDAHEAEGAMASSQSKKLTRRNFLKLMSAAGGGLFLSACAPGAAPMPTVMPTATAMPTNTATPTSTPTATPTATQTPTPLVTREYQGTNLAGWEIAVGDGIYAAPGELPVSLDDIQTIHFSTHSELLANVKRRRIMAHNITFKRIIDEFAFQYVHVCRFKFRLPYIPSTDNFDLNAQTLEGGLFIWDGKSTRLDYGLGFQWLLNPWMSNFGEVRSWRIANGGKWESVGYLKPDTKWHEARIVVDFYRETTSLQIDGIRYPSCFTATPKPETWGKEIAARLQVEIISVYPEPSGIRAIHKAEFRDWVWIWEPQNSYQVFLPSVRR